LVFTGYRVGDELVNSTELRLDSNSPNYVKVTWLLQYYLSVTDISGLASSLTGWYPVGSSLTVTVPSLVLYGNMTRLVFDGFYTNAPHYYVNGTSAELFIVKPTLLVVNWAREYNVTLRLFNPQGIFLGYYRLGWLREDYLVNGVRISGIYIPLEKPLVVNGPLLNSSINAVLGRFMIADYLNLPAPLVKIRLNCGNYTLEVRTGVTGYTPELLIPGYSCTYSRPILGYYSLGLLLTISLATAILMRRLTHGSAG
jgi:hypothetical protein